MDIVAFLTARLDEDERVALTVSEGPRKPEVWEAKPWPYGQAPRDWAVDCLFGAVVVDGLFKDAAIHIARHDPARVLRKVAAMRQILAVCNNFRRGSDPDGETLTDVTLRELAGVYDDHPDYDPAWTPE